MSLFRRRLMMAHGGGGKEYIVFEDPAVEAICVANWSSDGIGLTYEDAAAVTNIGNTFKDNTSIVAFDEFQYFTSVATLGAQAFMNCTALEKITLPTSCWKTSNSPIANCGSFWGCISLTRVDAQGLTTIGYADFQGCSNLVTFIDSNLQSIGYKAFYGCSSLEELDLRKVTTFVGSNNSCFDGAKIKILDIPLYTGSSIYTNGMFALEEIYNDNIATINLNSNTNKNWNKIYCSSLSSAPNITYRDNLPEFNSDIVGVMYAPKLITFSKRAYKYDKYYLPKVQVIENENLWGGTGTLLDFGEDLTTVGGYFTTNWSVEQMANLNIIIRAANPPTFSRTINNYTNRMPKAIYVPPLSVNSYKTTPNWSNYASIIFAIGGAEWIAEFGSADEYADYVSGVPRPNE